MSPTKSSVERIFVEVPAGTTAALEKAASDNLTTPFALTQQYILHGIEQTILGREFDLAMHCVPSATDRGSK